MPCCLATRMIELANKVSVVFILIRSFLYNKYLLQHICYYKVVIIVFLNNRGNENNQVKLPSAKHVSH